MRLQACVLSATALALGGCVVGPDYHPPVAPEGAVQSWRTADPARETSAEPPDDWWRLYNDPKLDAYVAEAFAANHDLAAAEANLAASRAVLMAARAGRYPSTEATAGAIYGRDPSADALFGALGSRNDSIWKFDDLLDVSYELDLFGRVRRSIEAARADAEATAAARDDLKVTIAAETTRAYVSICVLGEQVAVAEHSQQVVNRELDIAIRRKAAGGGSEFDVVRTQVLASQVRASVPPLRGQRRAALFQLGALLGKTPAFAPEEALACASPPRLSALIPVGDGAGLLRRRPDIREAERRLASQTARVGVATADLYPRITFSGFYGGAAKELHLLTEEQGLAWGVGPSVSWSFPNQAGPRARVRASKANATAALELFDSAVLRGLKETEQALATYSAELDRRQALEDARAQAHRAFDLARGQVAAGAVSTLDLLTSEQQMVAADAAIASSDAALLQDEIGLFKALGGGWRSPAAAKTAP